MKRRIMTGLFGSAFKRNLLSVASGTALAHVVTIAAAPILSRLFAPEEYGLLGTFTTLSALLGAIACLRLDAALVAADPTHRRNVLIAAVVVTGCTTLITSAVSFLSGLFGPYSILVPYSAALAALPLTVAAIGLYNIASQWLAVTDRFNSISISNVARTVTGHAGQFVSAVITREASGLIWGNFLGHCAALGFVLQSVHRCAPDLAGLHIRRASILRTLRTQRDFVLFGTPQTLLSILNYSFPILVLATGFEPAIVGAYAMAQRLLTMPAGVVANALRQVLYPRLAEAQEFGTIRPTIVRITRLLVPSVLLGAVVAYFGSPTLFPVVLGGEWEQAGRIAQYLTFWVAASLISLPVVTAFPLIGLQQLHSRLEFFLFLARLTATLFGVRLGNLQLAVLVPSLISLLSNTALTIWMLSRPSEVWRGT